jgi:hypothetical protein
MKTRNDFYIGIFVALLIFALAFIGTAEKPREPQPVWCCSLENSNAKR